MDKEFENGRKNSNYQLKSIEAILSITKPGYDILTTETLFQRAVGVIQEVLGFRTIIARLYDPENKCFKLMSHGGMKNEMVEKLKCIPEDSSPFLEMMKEKEPVIKPAVKPLKDSGYKKILYIPLIAWGSIVGTIELPTKRDLAPTEDELRWFALVGKLLGCMICQMQRSTRMLGNAVAHERTRLANELHDEFSQNVRSIKWGLEEAYVSLENKQYTKTKQVLKKLGTLAQYTSLFLREELLGLREIVDPNQGVIQILEGMLLRFEFNWGIKTRFLKKEDASKDFMNILAPEAEIQLIRIVHQALTNIRQHANATTVSLSIIEDGKWIVCSIIDDGIGFRLEDVPEDRLGIRMIKERATSVGGMMEIISDEGKGTIVKVELPKREGSLA
ncbi:GAF domain-containing sensor histidine kinase [Chloroflexota bacterium]